MKRKKADVSSRLECVHYMRTRCASLSLAGVCLLGSGVG